MKLLRFVCVLSFLPLIAFAQTAAVFRVGTIAALESVNTAGLSTGYQYSVGGYNSDGDGGGGIFTYNSTSVATQDNVIIFTPVSNVGRWTRRTEKGLLNALYGGVDNTGMTDTTALENNVIAVAKANNGIYQGVFNPAGSYLVSSINLTNLSGFKFVGAGTDATRFNPNTNGVHVFDTTGSEELTIADIQIGYYNQTAIPLTAIFMAQVASGVSNQIFLDDLYISGSYSRGTLYDYGVPSSHAKNCRVYNYVNAAEPVIDWTATNDLGLSSTYATVTTGTQSTSDWSFLGCEIHDFTQNAGASPIWLDGIGNLSWFGGNISFAKNASQFVSIRSNSSALLFDGVTFYSDLGFPPQSTININGAFTLTGLTMEGVSVQATSAVLGGNPNATYDTITYFGKKGGATNIIGNGNAITVLNALVNCDGGQINISSGSITRSILFNPSTITASVNTALSITTVGQTFGGAQTFGALTATTLNGNTFTTGTYTLTGVSGKTLTFNNSITLAGTDGTTLTFQGSDTYLGRATTDTLTNKTFDTAGTGNIFKINGTTINALTGTGANVLQTSPSLITPNIGAASGTSLSVTGQLNSTVTTGTPPLVVTSTTNVPNLNASSISGNTFASPGPIGSGTASTGAFTTLSATSTSTFAAVNASGVVTATQAGTGNAIIAKGSGNGAIPLGIYNPTMADTNLVSNAVGVDGSTSYKSAEYGFILGTSGATYFDSVVSIYVTGDSQTTGLFVGKGGNVTVHGTLSEGGKTVTYNNVATAGIGLTPVVSTPRNAAVTNATASLTAYTVPATDSSYEVSANVQVTASTVAAMTVTCTYTDETNTSRTLTLGFTQLSGATLVTSITNALGTGPYEGITYHIRCKASTTITFATTGTVTGITYNIEGTIVQLQ